MVGTRVSETCDFGRFLGRMGSFARSIRIWIMTVFRLYRSFRVRLWSIIQRADTCFDRIPHRQPFRSLHILSLLDFPFVFIFSQLPAYLLLVALTIYRNNVHVYLRFCQRDTKRRVSLLFSV